MKSKKEKEKELSKAFKLVFNTIKNDKDLYRSYQATIAVSYFDNALWAKSRDSRKKLNEIGNNAADYFLKMLLA